MLKGGYAEGRGGLTTTTLLAEGTGGSSITTRRKEVPWRFVEVWEGFSPFQVPKMGGISGMWCLRETHTPQNRHIRFSTSILGTWKSKWVWVVVDDCGRQLQLGFKKSWQVPSIQTKSNRPWNQALKGPPKGALIVSLCITFLTVSRLAL